MVALEVRVCFPNINSWSDEDYSAGVRKFVGDVFPPLTDLKVELHVQPFNPRCIVTQPSQIFVTNSGLLAISGGTNGTQPNAFRLGTGDNPLAPTPLYSKIDKKEIQLEQITDIWTRKDLTPPSKRYVSHTEFNSGECPFPSESKAPKSLTKPICTQGSKKKWNWRLSSEPKPFNGTSYRTTYKCEQNKTDQVTNGFDTDQNSDLISVSGDSGTRELADYCEKDEQCYNFKSDKRCTLLSDLNNKNYYGKSKRMLLRKCQSYADQNLDPVIIADHIIRINTRIISRLVRRHLRLSITATLIQRLPARTTSINRGQMPKRG